MAALSRRTRRWGGVLLVLVVGVCAWGATRDWSSDVRVSEFRSGPGTHAYLHLQRDEDEPVTWDACTPITYELRGRSPVEGGTALVEDAVVEVEDASGLTFERVGDDADVVIRWSRPRADDDLDDDVAGYASASIEARDGRHWYDTGEIVLDGPQLADIADGHDGDLHVRGVVMHEFGHVVGLDHVDDRGELMHPRSRHVTWGPGDLAGLAELGASCGS